MKLTNSLLILFGLMLSMPAPSQVLTALGDQSRRERPS